jgi:hypothetical protein
MITVPPNQLAATQPEQGLMLDGQQQGTPSQQALLMAASDMRNAGMMKRSNPKAHARWRDGRR